MLLILFAQRPGMDFVADWSGWGGAGLLGLVLAWLLLKHLPAKDQQIKDMIDSRDALLIDSEKRHAEEMTRRDERSQAAEKVARDDYERQLKLVIDHCQAETKLMAGSMERSVGEMLLEIRGVLEELNIVRQRQSSGRRTTPLPKVAPPPPREGTHGP